MSEARQRWRGKGWLLIVGLSLCVVAVRADGPRTWTSSDGATLEAVFVEFSHQQVVLETPDGQRMLIHVQGLSEADQRYLHARQEAIAAAAAAEAEAAAEAAAAAEQAKAAEIEAWTALLGGHLVNARGNRIEPSELVGRKVGLYFSAAWCPPCRAFTPKLVEAYDAIRQAEQPFEIVFVSRDRSRQDMRSYMRDYRMPWLAVSYTADERDALPQRYSIRGIPALVIVSADGTVLSRNGVGEVNALGAEAFQRW